MRFVVELIYGSIYSHLILINVRDNYVSQKTTHWNVVLCNGRWWIFVIVCSIKKVQFMNESVEVNMCFVRHSHRSNILFTRNCRRITRTLGFSSRIICYLCTDDNATLVPIFFKHCSMRNRTMWASYYSSTNNLNLFWRTNGSHTTRRFLLIAEPVYLSCWWNTIMTS